MKVAIFGLGYVGFTAACCIAQDGHEVLGVDVSNAKVDMINSGKAPISEPGLADMLNDALAAGRIRAVTDCSGQLEGVDLILVCVGTPSAADGAHDMRYIADVSRNIGHALSQRETAHPVAVVYRSTMRPGSCDGLIAPLLFGELSDEHKSSVQLGYNPEFLREGSAVKDYYAPPKIVIGTLGGEPCEQLEELNKDLDAPRFTVGLREAEITKFVDNSFHALKVAFANEIGRVCREEGIDVAAVHEIFVSDTKLNISPYYLRPGGAFGGSCLPKDVRALNFIAEDIGAQTHIINTIVRSNEAHKLFLFNLATKDLEPGAKVLLNGLAFKTATDDLRESPNLDLARRLIAAGYELTVYDENLDPEALMGSNLGYSYSHLPRLGELIRNDVKGERFDRVIDARGDAEKLGVDCDEVVAIDKL